MHLKSTKECRLAIGSYPNFIYNATGGGGEALLVKSIQVGKEYVRFSPKTFQIPSLSWKTTKFMHLPLPPGIKINICMDKLEGTINKVSGEISLNFEASFTLEILSIIKFPSLFVKTILNTGKVQTNNIESQGLKLQKNGKSKLVGTAYIRKTDNYLLNRLLFLPTTALAELNCIIE